MLFDWGGNNDIDVVNVLKPNAISSNMWTGDCGSNSACTVWQWMSYDFDGDGINGTGMVDGPFAGMNANFNLGAGTVDLCCDAATRCNDSNACTADSCDSATGACVNTAISCDDNNTCTADSCDPATGCTYTPLADETTCTVNGQAGSCTGGICIPYPPCNGVKSVTIRGGGQKPGTVDMQIQTEFTVVNGGCIVDSTNSTVTVTSGTILQFNCKAGIGPHPTSGTWKGNALTTGSSQTIECPEATGEVGKLILDNKLAGGKDSDRMTIMVQ